MKTLNLKKTEDYKYYFFHLLSFLVILTISFSSVFAQSLSSAISSSSDDVEEWEDGFMSLSSSDLELVYDGVDIGNQTVGFRFNNLDIPQGAEISSAYIRFAVDETNNVSTNLTIRGEAADNAEPFTQTYANLSSRYTTNASVNWQPDAWEAEHEFKNTPDLKDIVQEIVNRSNWASNNSMVFIITGTGKRTAESYDGAGSNEELRPQLFVEIGPQGPTYHLTVNEGTGSGYYPENMEVDIIANDPPPNYVFDQWTGHITYIDDIYDASTFVTMPAQEVSVTATYEEVPTYQLTVNEGTGSGYYPENMEVDIIANDPPPNYIFDQWTGHTTYIDDIYDASTFVTMPAQPVSVTATYIESPGDPPLWEKEDGGYNIYRLNGNVGIGTDEPNKILEIYEKSLYKDATLRINSYKGYSGDNWYTWDIASSVDEKLHFSYAHSTSTRNPDTEEKVVFTSNGYILGNRFSELAASNYFLDPGNTNISLLVAGKVGIGTSSSPSDKLEVNGVINSKSAGFRFPDGSLQTTAWESNSSDIFYDKGKVSIGGSSTPAERLEVHGKISTTQGFIFPDGSLQTTAWESNSNDIFYDKGKAGIGTDIPATMLHIKGSDADLTLELEPSGANMAELRFVDDGVIKANIYYNRSDEELWLKNGSEGLVINNSGNVGIGTSNLGSYKLSVNGKIRATEIKVEVYPWSDYVFNSNYRLKTLDEVEKYIIENKHLPDVPDEEEVKSNGINVGEMNSILLRKIEEQTLYIIELNKKIEELQKQINEIKSR